MAQKKKPIEIIEENRHPLLRISKEWKRAFIKDIAKVQNGFAFESAFFTKDSGLPLIRIRDIDKGQTESKYIGEYKQEYVVERGDILVGMDGDFKAAKWNGNPGLLNQRVCRIFPDPTKVDKAFFFFTLQPYLDAIHEETSAVTVKHLSSRTIEEIPIPLPPLPIQQAIVARLEALFSELDKGIEQLKTARQQLRTYRQAVLKAAFEGRLTGEQVKEGELPEGWKWESLSNLGALVCGQSPSVAEVNREHKGILYVTGPEQWNGRHIEEVKWTEHPKRIAPKNSIFITVKGAGVGKLFPGIDCAIGRDIYAFKPNENTNMNYVFYALKSSIEEVIRKANGDIPGLSKNHILDHVIGICSKDLQGKVIQEIESRLSVADKLEETITQGLQQAEALRQSILKKAFEGEIV